MAKVKIKPIGDRVLVKHLEEKEQVRGGIIIPDSAKEKPQEAEQTGDSFMSHLVELRSRLLRAVGTMLVVFIALFSYPGASFIYDLLAALGAKCPI